MSNFLITQIKNRSSKGLNTSYDTLWNIQIIKQINVKINYLIFHVVYIGFPRWLSGKKKIKNACNAGDAGDAGSIPGSGRSPREGNGNPLQYFAWEIPWTEELAGCSP